MRKICKILLIVVFIGIAICDECFDDKICDVKNTAEIKEVVRIFNSRINDIQIPFGILCMLPPEIRYEFCEFY